MIKLEIYKSISVQNIISYKLESVSCDKADPEKLEELIGLFYNPSSSIQSAINHREELEKAFPNLRYVECGFNSVIEIE